MSDEREVSRIARLTVEYAVIPEEPAEGESGYSLGYPGAPAEVEIFSCKMGDEDVGHVINDLELATGLDVWGGLQERILAGEGVLV